MATEGAPPIAVFSVGWIAALSHELTAARLMLDKEYGEPPANFDPPRNDDNTYTFGRIGQHHVVIAALAAGNYGTVSAAETASKLSVSMPHIRVGLMVGIGAGVGERHEIRLGDIAVSEPSGTHGGLVQYDFFKAATDNGVPRDHRIGHLNKPPRALLTALQKLKSSHDMDESRVHVYIEEAFQRRSKLRKTFGFPGRENDPRFKTVGGCDNTGDPESNRPKIYYGVIASGNKLVKRRSERDEVLDWLAMENIRPICFEMEAAGLMNTFPCLVIRGICDYADEDKNDVWQNYAALIAAAFAKDLLRHVEKREIDKTLSLAELGDNVQALKQGLKFVENETSSANKKLAADDFAKLVNWLCPSDISFQHIRKREEWLHGTGTWFSNHPRYKEWMSHDGTCTLYCEGAPGAGKTTLATSVADLLLDTVTNDANVVLVLFCDYARRNEQSKATFLTTILRQLLHRHGLDSDFTKKLAKSYPADKRIPNENRPYGQKLEVLLSQAVQQYECIYLVIDALDECDFALCREFLRTFRSLLGHKTLKLLATSRHNLNIRNLFPGAILLPIRANDSDVDLYVRRRAPELEVRIPNRPDFVNDVLRQVVELVDGVFLLAKLHMNNLVHLDTPNKIKAALHSIRNASDSYQQAYHETLNRIASHPKELRKRAFSILMWVTFAKRLLSTNELQHALATKFGQRCLDPDDVPEEATLFSICEGLVVDPSCDHATWTGKTSLGKVVVEWDPQVRLVHYTAEQYLKDFGAGWFAAAHLANTSVTLAGTCFTYLALDSTQAPGGLALLQYASQYAAQHAYDAESICYANNVDFEHLAQAVLPYLRLKEDQRLGDAIWYLVLNNLPNLLLALRSKFGLKSYVGVADRTPLMYAADVGKHSMVSALLTATKGAHLCRKDSHLRTALHFAARSGHLSTLSLILDSLPMATIDAEDIHGHTAFYLAAEGGHASVTEMLANTGKVDLEQHAKDRSSPLTAAARGLHDNACGLILRRLPGDDSRRRCLEHAYLHCFLWRFHESPESVAKSLALLERLWPPLSTYRRWITSQLARFSSDALKTMARFWLGVVPCYICRKKGLSHLFYCPDCLRSKDETFILCVGCTLKGHWCYCSEHILQECENATTLQTLGFQRGRAFEDCSIDDAFSTAILRRYRTNHAICHVCRRTSLMHGFCCTLCSANGLNVCVPCIRAGCWCRSIDHDMREIRVPEAMCKNIPSRTRVAREHGSLSVAQIALAYFERRVTCEICTALSDHGFHCAKCPGTVLAPPSTANFNICSYCERAGYWCYNIRHVLDEYNSKTHFTNKKASRRLRKRILRRPSLPSTAGATIPASRTRRNSTSILDQTIWRAWAVVHLSRPQVMVTVQRPPDLRKLSRFWKGSINGLWPRFEALTQTATDHFRCIQCGISRASPYDQSPAMQETCIYCDLDITGQDKDFETKWCFQGRHNVPRNDFITMESNGRMGKERRTICNAHGQKRRLTTSSPDQRRVRSRSQFSTDPDDQRQDEKDESQNLSSDTEPETGHEDSPYTHDGLLGFIGTSQLQQPPPRSAKSR